MRELERDLPSSPAPGAHGAAPADLAIAGAGRVGGSLAAAARSAGLSTIVTGREDRGPVEASVVLICVPDDAVAPALTALLPRLGPGTAVGHVSGAHDLSILAPAARAGHPTFSIHPLMTIPDRATLLVGVPSAIAGRDGGALELARGLALRLEMKPFEVPDERRAAYHAAASIASNFLVALEESAAELLAAAEVTAPRELLTPLVLRSAANWAEGGREALTGPIARGDEATVARHREAIRAHAPELLKLYDALAEQTRRVAGARTTADSRQQTADSDDGLSSPRLARTRAELDALLGDARAEQLRIGLVPTMGFLHEGHLSLIRAAAASCDVVVMSLFVNPAQFGPGEDLDTYPRDEARDLELAGEAGATIVFAPPTEEVYRPGFSTSVSVTGLTDVLCGDPSRRGAEHFQGVTTVVAKLLNIVRPGVAYFGQKDAQQAIVIKRMAADLDFPAQIEVLPTVRERDGLAMSSRNTYLTPEERIRALALNRALLAAEAAAAAGETTAEAVLGAARMELEAAEVEPEYLEARDAEDLTKASRLNGRPVLIAVAAKVGRARLIDNTVITPPSDG